MAESNSVTSQSDASQDGASSAIALRGAPEVLFVAPQPARLGGIASALVLTESAVNGAPQLIAALATFTAADAALAGGAIVVSNSASEVTIGIQHQGDNAGEIGVTDDEVRYGGVVIGTVTGGAGGDFTLTFNSDVTSEAAQAALRSLTYANSSDVQTTVSPLHLEIRDSAGASLTHQPSAFAAVTTQMPFAGTDSDNIFNPAFIDLNGDGLLDIVVGTSAGQIDAYVRALDGTVTKLVGTDNPFAMVNTDSFAAPAFVDFDGDGLLDLVVAGGFGRGINSFRNNGDGSFSEVTGPANPFDGLLVGSQPDISFVDVDNDGDLDLLSSTLSGFRYFRNDNGAFSRQSGVNDPFSSLGLSSSGTTFLDLDGDGFLDLIVRGQDGLEAARNNGNGTFTVLTHEQNPLYAQSVYANLPQAVDYDGDGDMDLVYGILFQGIGVLRNDAAPGTGIMIDVTWQNDAPTSGDPSETLNAGESREFSIADFPFADAEGDTLHSVVITSLPTFGILSLDGVPVTVGQSIAADDLGLLSYLAGATAGDDSFVFQVRDSGGTANGGSDLSASHIFSFTVAAADAAPDGSDSTVAIVFGQPLVLTEDHFGFSDEDGDALAAVIITTLPGSGTLRLDGVDVSAGQSVSAANIAAGLLVYTPGAAGLHDFTFQVRDDSGVAGSDLDTTPNRLELDVAANRAPQVGGLATSTTFLENTVNAAPQVLMADATFTDPDGNLAGGVVSLSGLLAEDRVAIRNEGVDAGQIGVSGNNVTFGGVEIGTFTGGAGDSFSVTLNAAATSEAVEALLRNLTYANVSDAPAETRNLLLQISDNDGAYQGRSPVFFTPLAGEDASYAQAPSVTIYLSAYLDLNGDGVLDTVVGRYDGYFDSYLRNADGTLTQISNPFGQVYFGRQASPGAIDFDNDGLVDLVMTGQSGEGFRSFRNNGDGSFTELTGGANPMAGHTSFGLPSLAAGDVDGDGDDDLLAADGSYISYFRNDGGTFQRDYFGPFAALSLEARGLAFVDMDDDGRLDLLVTTNNGSVRVARNDGNGNYSLLTDFQNPFAGFPANYNFVSAIDYDGDGDLDLAYNWYGDGFRMTTGVSRNDTANGQYLTINVTPQNDAPSGTDRTITVTEDGSAMLGSAAFGFTDSDGHALGAVIITTLPAAGTLYLTVGGNAVAVTQGQSIAAADILAGRLSFVPAADGFGDTYASLTFQVQDNGGVANGGVDLDSTPNAIIFDVTPTPDPLSVTGVVSAVTWLENDVNAAPRLLIPDAVFSDADNGLDGGTISITGLLGEDRVTILSQGEGAGQIGVSDNEIRYGGVAIATFTGGAGNALTIDFNGSESSAAVEAVLRSLSYANVSETPTATRQLVLQVTDGAGFDLGRGASTFTPVTSPFPVSNPSRNAAPAFGDINGDGVLDVVIGNSDGRFDTYLGNADGSLTQLTGAANPFGNYQLGSGAMPLLADLNGDGALDFGAMSGATFGMHVSYNNGDGTFTAVADNAQPYYYVTASYGQVAFVDLDNDGDLDGVVAQRYRGTSSYWQDDGSMWYSGNDPIAALGIGDPAGVAAIDFDYDGWMDLVIPTDSGALHAVHNNRDGTFSILTGAADPLRGSGMAQRWTYAVQSVDFDGDGDLDLVYANLNYTEFQALRNDAPNGIPITVNVTAQNDAPQGRDMTLTMPEDGVAVLRTANFFFSDVEGSSFAGILVTTLPSHGTLYLSSGSSRVAVTEGAYISPSDISAGRLIFVAAPDAHGQGYSSFTFQVYDYGGVANGGSNIDPTPRTVTFDVTPTVDAPELGGLPASITLLEDSVNAAPQSVAPDASFANVDDDMDGGTLVVRGLLTEDRVAVRQQGDGPGETAISGDEIRYGGVLIGTFAGGVGDTLTVTFNAAATAEAVETVIANLTYANISDTPTATRTLNIQVTNAGGGLIETPAAFTELVGSQNPFGAITIDSTIRETMALGDLNGDSLVDLVVGGGSGSVRTFIANSDGTFALQPSSVFSGVTGNSVAPAFFDFDGDGDRDLIIGAQSRSLRLYEAQDGGLTDVTGTGEALGNVFVSSVSQLAFTDVDRDGRQDLVLVRNLTTSSSILWYNEVNGVFQQRSEPVWFAGVTLGVQDTIAFLDLDQDGRDDLVVSGNNGVRAYLGTTNGYTATSISDWGLPSISGARVTSGDFDNDGDLDLIFVRPGEAVRAFVNNAVRGIDVTVNVTAQDDVAVPQDDVATAAENDTIVIDILGNDSDPDGGPGRVLAAINGEAVSADTVIVLPSGALVTIDANGTVLYDANGAFAWLVSDTAAALAGATNDHAVDRFSYTLGDGSTAWIEVTVTGVDGPGDHFVGSVGDDVVTGRALVANFIDLSGGGSDQGIGGDEDDGFYLGGTWDASDVIDGGAGWQDQLGIQGSTTVVLGAGSLTGIEQLVLLPGSDARFGDMSGALYSYDITMHDANVASRELLIVQANTLRAGETFRFNGAAENDGWFMTYGGLGDDHIIGGQQNDGFYFGVGRFGSGDTLDGQGGGMDQLGLQGDYTGADAITFGADQLASVEMIVLLSGADSRFNGGGAVFNYDLTVDDANALSGARMMVQANTLRADETLTLDASAETDAHYWVYGGAGDDRVIGGDLDDALWGNAGDDVLAGGGGADDLHGGLGNDVFRYLDATDSTAAARDRIFDFASGDRIDLAAAGFTSFASDGFSSVVGQVIATWTGSSWLVEGDADGDGFADLSIRVDQSLGYGWSADDFILGLPLLNEGIPFDKWIDPIEAGGAPGAAMVDSSLYHL